MIQYLSLVNGNIVRLGRTEPGCNMLMKQQSFCAGGIRTGLNRKGKTCRIATILWVPDEGTGIARAL